MLLGSTACGDLEQPSQVLLIPNVPPPPDLPPVPPTLAVRMVIDGVEVTPLSGGQLEGTSADYVSERPARKGWNLGSVVALPDGPFELIIDGKDGISLQFEFTGPEVTVGGEVVPTLLWRRRGDLVAATLNPDNPFEGYHLQGQRTRRIGDPLPRLIGVSRIRINRLKAQRT